MTKEDIINCRDCIHCFKSKRSPSGYVCEVWGYDDFASPTILDGFCHKAKKKPDIKETPNDNRTN